MSDSSGISRRNFFGAGVTAGTIAALGTAVPLLGTSSAAAAAVSRTFTGAMLALEVDGTPAGVVNGAEGGGFQGILSQQATSAASTTRSIVAGFKQVPLKIAFSGGISGKVLEWFAACDMTTRNVDLVLADGVGTQIFRLSLRSARVIEFGVGKLDASSSELLEFVVTLLPEQTFQQLGGNGKISGTGLKQKTIRVNSFRFFIQGLEASTQQTSQIEAFSTRIEVFGDGTGSSTTRQFGTPEFELVTAKVALGSAGPLYQWFSDFIAGKASERAGQIQLLALDGKPVATIDLIGLRPLRVATPFAGLNTPESVPAIKLEFQPTGIRFNLKDLAG
jgi:hypothetical protein